MKRQKYKWDFKDFFASDEAFLEELERFKQQIQELSCTINDFPLAKKLEKYYSLSLMGEKLISYAELNSDLDISNEKYMQYKNQVYLEKSKLDIFKNNINEEISTISISLDEYLATTENMSPYKMHLYDVLRLKEHVNNSHVITNENVLIQRVNSLYNIIMNVEMPLETIELDGKLIKVNRDVYNRNITNKNRMLREKSFKAFMKSLKNVNKSIGNLFCMRYQMCYDIAKEESYESILESVIKKDDLDMRIIENLISSVHKNLSLLNRYIALKKKRWGLDDFHFYDLNISSDYNPKYSFLEGIDIVKDALKDFGEDYEKALNEVLEGGMLDVFPDKHKFAGGYHWRNYTKPMILMNYKGNFREVATIGHELGHAVNGILVRDNQEFQNFHFSIFLSEIASTVNEDRVEEYMYKTASDENKIIHLEQIIDKTVTAIYFQMMFLEFQKELCTKIEKGESVSADIINETFLFFFHKYYENIEIDEELKYLWQIRLHLFYDVHRYYNFQYATGKIISIVINQFIKEGKVAPYLEFLKVGGSLPPLKALLCAGIDLTQEKIYENAFYYLEELLNKYESLLEQS